MAPDYKIGGDGWGSWNDTFY